MADKTFINKCSLKEKVFDNGGRLLNAAFNVAELSRHANAEGWVRIVIAPRRHLMRKGRPTMRTRTSGNLSLRIHRHSHRHNLSRPRHSQGIRSQSRT